jgi:hypothetical protein
MCQHQPGARSGRRRTTWWNGSRRIKPGKAGGCAAAPACSATGDWPPGRAAASQMSWVKAQRARENSAYVRKLLGQRQPEFAAALAFAEQYFSCLLAGERRRGSAR